MIRAYFPDEKVELIIICFVIKIDLNLIYENVLYIKSNGRELNDDTIRLFYSRGF